MKLKETIDKLTSIYNRYGDVNVKMVSIEMAYSRDIKDIIGDETDVCLYDY